MPLSRRERELRQALDEVRARCDVAARVASDPVEFVHRTPPGPDRELVALLASCLAFGNVRALRAKIADALARIGPDLAGAAENPDLLRARLRSWKHRVFVDDDLARLLVGARRVQRARSSLGEALEADLEEAGELREALVRWTSRIREAGGLDVAARRRRGAAHILPDPSKGSAVKRLLLLLRWMARPEDGVDLGLWRIPPRLLLVPVDTHLHKLGKNLGLTRRAGASWKAAEDITRALSRFDPEDPVKYDFALCHLGMLQGCPSRRDPARCEGCGVRKVCSHWDDGGESAPQSRAGGRTSARARRA